MDRRPTVAVIIPTYNRAQYVVQALDSALNQSRPPDEVLVIDDGSTDSTTEVLAGYRGRIRYLLKPNGGIASALNHGLAATDAEYIGILDDDDLLLPDALERHLDFLRSHPDIDFSYSGCYRFGADTPPRPPYADRLELYDCADVDPDDLFLHALETFPFHRQGMLVPLKCYSAVGMFDEASRRAEDYDMILRLAQEFRGAKAGAPTFLFRDHGGQRGPAATSHSVAERDKVFVEDGRRLFVKLRERLALQDYLPRADRAKPLDEAETRRARLQRACATARHGLFDEALEDVDAATAKALFGSPFTSDERRLCSRMMDMDPMLLEGGARFLRKAAQMLRQRAPSLFTAAVGGFRWSISREYRNGHHRTAVTMTARLVQAVGVRGCLSLAASVRGRTDTSRTAR